MRASPLPRSRSTAGASSPAGAAPKRAAAAVQGNAQPRGGAAPCSCGGNCPRCADPGRPIDPALRAPLEASFGTSLAAVRVHTDAAAQQFAREQHAHALTIGSDIYFAPGRYQPHSADGATRLAHELVHTQQQVPGAGGAAASPSAEAEARSLGAAAARGEPARVGQRVPVGVQRDAADGVVDMPPITITSSLHPTGAGTVPGIGALNGQGLTPGTATLAHSDEDIARNSPDPTRLLPFTSGGWDGNAILTALGQYDTLPGTDSDALRCVQAVAMAARVPQGPDAVVGFIRATMIDGSLSQPETPRKRAALAALEHVIARIEMRHATFADLMWAQEALHDLFYDDASGTPVGDIRDRIAPALDLGMRLDRLDLWCNSPAEVLAQASHLARGEQLIVTTWQVIFNHAFDDLSEQHIEVATGDSIVVNVNGRNVRIRRIPERPRPDHTAIDAVRDHQGGHQLLVMRDATSDALRLYEPETTGSGQHLETLAPDGSNFTRYFQDYPDAGIYQYIEILGKLTPQQSGGLGMSP